MLIAVVLVVTVVGIVLARGVRDAAAEARAQTAAAGDREDPGATPSPGWGLEPGAGSPSSASAGSTADGVPPGASAQPSGGLPGSDAADWWTVLDGLDARRAQAIATADSGAIGSYAAARSAFDRSEVQLIGQLARDRLHPRGWRTTVIAIESVEGPRSQGSGESVVLTVVDERSAYELVDEAGTVVRRVPTSAKRRWHITLTRQSGGLRPSSIGSAGSGDDTRAVPGESAQDPAEAGPASGATPNPGEGPGAPGADEGLDDARSAVADDNALQPPEADGEAAGGDSPQASTWRIASVELLA